MQQWFRGPAGGSVGADATNLCSCNVGLHPVHYVLSALAVAIPDRSNGPSCGTLFGREGPSSELLYEQAWQGKGAIVRTHSSSFKRGRRHLISICEQRLARDRRCSLKRKLLETEYRACRFAKANRGWFVARQADIFVCSSLRTAIDVQKSPGFLPGFGRRSSAGCNPRSMYCRL